MAESYLFEDVGYDDEFSDLDDPDSTPFDSRLTVLEDWTSVYETELLDLYYDLVKAAQIKGCILDRADFHAFCAFAFAQSSKYPPN